MGRLSTTECTYLPTSQLRKIWSSATTPTFHVRAANRHMVTPQTLRLLLLLVFANPLGCCRALLVLVEGTQMLLPVPSPVVVES